MFKYFLGFYNLTSNKNKTFKYMYDLIYHLIFSENFKNIKFKKYFTK